MVNKPFGYIRSLPLIVFGFMSSLTSIDILKETPFSHSNKIFHVIKLAPIVLGIVYCVIGLAGYFRFGNELTAFDCGNILLNAEFSRSPILLCNFLIAIFVGINGVLKFKPAKELITGMVRDSARDSKLWHYFVILTLHIAITTATCIVVSQRIRLHEFFAVIAGFTCPSICFVYPFVAFRRVFYFDQREKARRYCYNFLIYCGVFVNTTTIGAIVFNYWLNF